jgi:EmrB/QacA subfamily drug resistance transporter
MSTIVNESLTESRTVARGHSWGALLVLIAGIFIVTLDFFIVNVAIPATQADLHASSSAVQFVVAGYGLSLAALLITAGRLGDLYGRRRLFTLGLGLFTLASAACGAAPTAGVLIAARVVQGGAAALMLPQALGIIQVTYSGEKLTKAFKAYGLAIGLGAVFGQLIGGALIKADVFGLGWRSIFLINIPVGIAAVAGALRLLPESRADGASTRIDALGTVLVSLGLVAIVLPLVEGQQQGWPLWTWLCLSAALPLLAGFAYHQRRMTRRGGAPLVHLGLFAERAFSAGIALTVLFQMTMASFFLVLALYLQDGRGLSALESGAIFLPMGLGYFLGTTHAPRIAARLGRHVLSLGGLVIAAGYGALALVVHGIGNHGAVTWVIPAFLVAGYGMGIYIVPSTPIILAGVEPEHAASASGILSTAQQAGGAIGVAVIGVVFYNTLGSHPVPAHIPHAFGNGLELLVALSLGVAAHSQLLPKAAQH